MGFNPPPAFFVTKCYSIHLSHPSAYGGYVPFRPDLGAAVEPSLPIRRVRDDDAITCHKCGIIPPYMEGTAFSFFCASSGANHPSTYGGYSWASIVLRNASESSPMYGGYLTTCPHGLSCIESSLRIWRVYLRKSTFFDGRWVLYTMIQFNFLPEHTDHPRMHAPSQFQHAMLAAMHPNQ